ncbi:MAG: DUF4239 domain-containing protein [Alphaproteobacteria bacterium]|nr:DUF4239 domain-containing protein [Alphaproteobacteria bacterium]
MTWFQWIASQPLWVSATLLIGAGVLLSIISAAVVNSYYTPAELQGNSLVGGFKYAFLSSVFAGYLGLLLFGAYQKYEEVRVFVDEEVDSLESMRDLASGFPMATRDVARAHIREYARSVAEDEWPLLHLGGSPATEAKLNDVFSVYMAMEPQSEKERAIYQISLDNLLKVRDMRSRRMLIGQGALHPLLLVSALVGTVVSIVFPAFFASAHFGATLTMSVMVTIVTMTVVLIVVKFTYPFLGEYGVSAEQLRVLATAR